MNNVASLYNQPAKKNDVIGKLLNGSEYTRKVLCRQDNQPPETHKSLEQCAFDVNRLDQSSFENTLAMGEIFSYVKKTVKSGQFVKWIKDNTKISHRTANNAMILFRVTIGHPELLKLDRSIIYVLGTKGFTKQILKLLDENAVGSYNITKPEVLLLKVALRNGQVTPESIELDKFFKKRDDIDVEARLNKAKEKLVCTLKRQRKEYEDFIKQQAEAAGRKFENQFTRDSRFIMKVLDDTITAIYRGPESATSAVRMITYQPQLKLEANTLTDEPPTTIETAPSPPEIPVKSVKKPLRPRAHKKDRAADGVDVDQCDIEDKGEEAIPDEAHVSCHGLDLSELTGECWVPDDEVDDTLDKMDSEDCKHATGDYLVNLDMDGDESDYGNHLCQDDLIGYCEEEDND